MRGYRQFCPIAKSCEVLGERWTLLVVRELLNGSTRFSELERGVPLMSKTLLAQRLRELERAGVLERRPLPGARGHSYHLTGAGEEHQPVVELLGRWGMRWARGDMPDGDLDAGLLMWAIYRHVRRPGLPDGRKAVRFDLTDAPKGKRRWWLVLAQPDVDLCLKDPGYPLTLIITSKVRTLAMVYLGDLTLREAASSGRLELEGTRTEYPRLRALVRVEHLRDRRRLMSARGPDTIASPSTAEH